MAEKMTLLGRVEAALPVLRNMLGSAGLLNGQGIADELLRDVRAHIAQPAQAVDVDYMPGELDRTAPERIWLQVDTSASNRERNELWPGDDGVSWCSEPIGGLEIQYVRGDLVTRAIGNAQAEGN